MMKITFKDVGQGDSIILEWQVDGVNKIGIIDCNKKGTTNPVLDHLIKEGYKEIEFLVLSHPHRDHYSGLSSLFSHIEKEKILIKRLGHTLHFTSDAYWKYFDIDRSATRLFAKTIVKMRNLYNLKLIKRMHHWEDEKQINLGPEIDLYCLGPCHDDAMLYQNIVSYEPDKNAKEASKAANHLSTIFVLDVANVSILLTADAENESFDNIITHSSALIASKTFHLCQAAHHGSIENLRPVFWDIVPTIAGKHAIISAGEHKKYNHPSYEVIEAFHNGGYTIHCTNIVNGMVKYTEGLSKVSLKLDAVSELAEEYLESNDRVFLIKDGICQLQ